MPYIESEEDRKKLDEIIYFYFQTLNKKGRVNYFLFKLAKDTCFSYGDFREFIGELECCKLEIIRRLLSPYEDKKIREFGDVK